MTIIGDSDRNYLCNHMQNVPNKNELKQIISIYETLNKSQQVKVNRKQVLGSFCAFCRYKSFSKF